MVHQHLRAAGQHIYKRFADEPEKITFPSWAPAVALADFIIFLPIILLVGYTLAGIIPTLAIVEDPNPPAYEPVALDEGTADPGPSAPGKPITSSLRATRRLLASVAGWRSYFRGIVLAAVIGAANTFVGGVIDSAIPFIPVGHLLAQLALTQLRTAWTHIVISAPSELRFYQRLPPFKKTFEATCFPIFVVWVAEVITISSAALLTKALGLPLRHGGGEEGSPNFSAHDAWKGLVILVVVIVIELVTIVPANVLLVRVQASLLGPDESVILPFDRSFGGKLEPAIVGGKGFITLRDAMASFSRPSWIRLYKLYAKIVAVTIAAYGLMMAVIVPEILLLMSKSSKA